ncbi:MAG: ATP-dependent Clp protease proteolytic subunit [Chitinophagales bacterium]|nr:ATP-dependent Clp protease proteolytic subunit [Chitinophagales bacterium]
MHINKQALLIVAHGDRDWSEIAKRYPLNIRAEKKEGKAHIHIEGTIWSFSHSEFKYELDRLIEDGVADVVLYINSPGGDVFSANQIINELSRFEGSVVGIGGAIVASAATLIASYCDQFKMPTNGQYMYHKPKAWIEGNEDEVASRLKLLRDITNQYRSRYSELTGLKEDEIEQNWSKGDVWLTAKEALENGFITEVMTQKEKVSPQTAMMIAACGAPHTIEIKALKSDNNMENRDELIATLKLAKDATDAQILEAVEALGKSAEKTEALQALIDKQQEAVISALVADAVKDKKIGADMVATYKDLARKDFESTKKALSVMPSITKLSVQIDDDSSGEAIKSKWTFDDYLANDPKGLEALAVNDPKKFAELEKAYLASNL